MSKMYDVNFLYHLRKNKMMSQQEFADILCVSRQTYSLLEKDCGRMPLDMFLKLIQSFNIKITEIIDPGPGSRDQMMLSELVSIKNELQDLRATLQANVY